MNQYLQPFISLAVVCVVIVAVSDHSLGQRRRSTPSNPTVKGSVVFDRKKSKSWNGDQLSIRYEEIEAKLREYVQLPPAPFPPGHKQWTPQQRIEWEKEFAQTPVGKKVVVRNKKLLEQANSFDIKIAKDGSFVVYDVPPGDYAIQGRIDKKIKDINYAYEVFGKLTVDAKVDLLELAPIRIAVTPQYQRGQIAPPLNVSTYNDKQKLQVNTFENRFLMLNFWSAASPVATKEQQAVQATIATLNQENDIPFAVLSINTDKDRKRALRLLSENKLTKGSHGFTLGDQHPAIANYGVRGVPSYWLIDRAGKILINQYEFAKLMQTKDSIATIIRDRIQNKDTPTLAKPQAEPKQ